MTMRENAAKVAYARAQREFDASNKAMFVGRENVAACRQAAGEACGEVGREIRALPDVPNPTRAALEECAEVILTLCMLVSHMPIKHPQQGAGRDELVARARVIASKARNGVV